MSVPLRNRGKRRFWPPKENRSNTTCGWKTCPHRSSTMGKNSLFWTHFLDPPGKLTGVPHPKWSFLRNSNQVSETSIPDRVSFCTFIWTPVEIMWHPWSCTCTPPGHVVLVDTSDGFVHECYHDSYTMELSPGTVKLTVHLFQIRCAQDTDLFLRVHH